MKLNQGIALNFTLLMGYKWDTEHSPGRIGMDIHIRLDAFIRPNQMARDTPVARCIVPFDHSDPRQNGLTFAPEFEKFVS